jgi:hypothetical protein
LSLISSPLWMMVTTNKSGLPLIEILGLKRKGTLEEWNLRRWRPSKRWRTQVGGEHKFRFPLLLIDLFSICRGATRLMFESIPIELFDRLESQVRDKQKKNTL